MKTILRLRTALLTALSSLGLVSCTVVYEDLPPGAPQTTTVIIPGAGRNTSSKSCDASTNNRVVCARPGHRRGVNNSANSYSGSGGGETVRLADGVHRVTVSPSGIRTVESSYQQYADGLAENARGNIGSIYVPAPGTSGPNRRQRQAPQLHYVTSPPSCVRW